MTAIALVTKPTVAEDARRETIEHLRELLASAEAGDVAEVFAVVKHPDGTWSSVWSTCTNTPEFIGRLEIAKQRAISRYLADDPA